MDDVLDFSKMENRSPEAQQEIFAKSLVEVDLEELVANVAKATAVRKRRIDRTSEAFSGVGNVDIIFDVYGTDWSVLADSAGIKRCLLNILGEMIRTAHPSVLKLTFAPNLGNALKVRFQHHMPRRPSPKENLRVHCRGISQSDPLPASIHRFHRPEP